MSSREPTQEDNFRTVARFLAEDFANLDDDEYEAAWDRCENARSRAAISRAYYAAFLALKYRLSHHRQEWPENFPSRRVHGKVIQALSEVLESSGRPHPLAHNFRQLRRFRERADYEWHHPERAGVVRTALRVSEEALAQVSALSRQESLEISGALWDIDRAG